MQAWTRTILCGVTLTATIICGAKAVSNSTESVNYAYSNTGVGEVKSLDPETRTYSAACSSDMIDGQEYVLLVTELTETGRAKVEHPEQITASDYTLEESDVVYMDQSTASQSKVTFPSFTPMRTPDCVVLLGGTFQNASTNTPKVLGTIKAQGVTVRMENITANGNKTFPTATLSGNGNQFPLNRQADGSYTADTVPNGTYTLTVQKPGHLTYSAEITIGREDQTLPSVNLLGGDVNNDGQIDDADVKAILAAYLQTPTPALDINETGKVNADDLSIVLQNYKAQYNVN